RGGESESGTPHVEAGRLVSGVLEGESVPAERTGRTSADHGASAGAGGGVRVGATALQLVPGSVRSAATGRDGGSQARRDGGEHGGGAEVWQRSTVLPAGRAASQPRYSVAAFDAMGHGGQS